MKDLGYLYCGLYNLKSCDVWMIHETDKELLKKLKNLNPKTSVLIWDDGLLSQFYPIKILQDLGFYNILAISTNIVNCASLQYSVNEEPILYESSNISHKRYHENNDARAFMSWEYVKELNDFGVYIAAHGYNHEKLERKLFPNALILKDICKKVQQDFLEHLNYYPKLYVYPYNLKFEWSDSLIHSYNMDTIGPGRLDARKL